MSDVWVPPLVVVEIADRHGVIPYTGATVVKPGESAQKPLPVGLWKLRNHVVDLFKLEQTYMPSRGHPKAGRMRDMHGEGRAVDFMVYRDRQKGDDIAAYLVDIAEQAGIQYFIWYGRQYQPGHPPGHRFAPYTGSTNPHHDHPHVEMTPEGARGETPFIAALPQPPPR